MQVIRQRYWVNPDEPEPELGWRPIDPYCIQDEEWTLVLKTRSKSATWYLHRFRLYTPDANTLVEARNPDGSVIDTQVFSSTNNFEHDFSFDLSHNTGHQEIDIYIKGVPAGASFQQLYAVNQYSGRYDSGGPGNAELSYINMNYMSLESNVGYVYIQNQITANNPELILSGAGQFFGTLLDVRNNNLPSSIIDQIIIGYNTNGLNNGTLSLQGNQGRTSASDDAYTQLINKGCIVNL